MSAPDSTAPSHLIMQEDMSRSRSSEHHSAKSSAQKSAESRSVDTRKPLLTEDENKTRAYLKCRLSELRVRKIDMEMAILDQHKIMTDSLMKDLDDFKIRVQKDDHVSADHQNLLEECLEFQRELEESWHTLQTKEQEYRTAKKKQKISDPRETKAARSRDQNVYPRPGQAASVIPVTSLDANGHVEDVIESRTDQALDPIVNSPGHRDKVILSVASQQARNVQEEASRSHANTCTQGEATKSHDQAITNSQQTVRTIHDAHVPTSQYTTGRAEAATGGTASNAGADDTATDCFQGPINDTDLPAKAEQSSIVLLMIGNCGNGKSATGNSILGKPAFRTSASSSVASASSIKMDSTDFAGKVVNVIDGPSINVSGNITPEEVRNITENINQSLELCNCSFTALVIILKFGIRYTKQETEALRVIKAELGKDVIREYGVCVITHGDGFDYSIEEAREFGKEMTFDSWLKEQTGEVTTLFKECNFRCVLFDNVTKDVTKRQAQLDKLMEILPKGKSYSKDEFSQARHGTEELEMEASLPTFLKVAQAEADKIKELLDQHEEIKKHDPEARNIKLKLHELKEKVDQMRVSSGELANLKMFLQVLESNLHGKLTKWQLERDIHMKMGVQGTTSARSSTPLLADQTKMGIDNTPYLSLGTDYNRDMYAPLNYNRDMSAPSNYNRDMSAPSNYNRDMSAPTDFNRGMSATSHFNGGMPAPLEYTNSKNETGSSVDKGSHAVSYTVHTQSRPLNDNFTTATCQMYATEITDRHPGEYVNNENFVVVDTEMVSGGGNALYPSII